MMRRLFVIVSAIASSKRRRFCGVALVLAVWCVGCDNHSFRYEARGSLLHPDGSPAAGQAIALTAARSASDRGEGDYPQGSQTTTGADGRYAVECRGGGYYPSALELLGLP